MPSKAGTASLRNISSQDFLLVKNSFKAISKQVLWRQHPPHGESQTPVCAALVGQVWNPQSFFVFSKALMQSVVFLMKF